MKKSISISVAILFFVSLVAFGINKPTKSATMPDAVKEVIENSCFGCHNTESKNEDGKEALDFKKLESLSKIKLIHAYKEIGEVVEENKMPPKKFLQRFPEKALSEDDKKLLINWSEEQAKALVKGM